MLSLPGPGFYFARIHGGLVVLYLPFPLSTLGTPPALLPNRRKLHPQIGQLRLVLDNCGCIPQVLESLFLRSALLRGILPAANSRAVPPRRE